MSKKRIPLIVDETTGLLDFNTVNTAASALVAVITNKDSSVNAVTNASKTLMNYQQSRHSALEKKREVELTQTGEKVKPKELPRAATGDYVIPQLP